MLCEIDYRAIEAVLVGYFAKDLGYIRLAKLGVHDFLNAYVVKMKGLNTELPDLKWSDADLYAFLTDIKERFPEEREGAKRTCHLSNYKGTPQQMRQKHPELFPTLRDAQALQELYFGLFPSITTWQLREIDTAATQGYLQTPWGNILRFHNVYEWKREGGRWRQKLSENAKEVPAFRPQSTAAGIIKESMLVLREYHPDVASYLRLQIHDSLLFQFPSRSLRTMIETASHVMARPQVVLPFDWDGRPNDYLGVDVEAKVSATNWATMKKVA